MLGASDLLATIQGGSSGGTYPVRLGTMTGYNTCQTGDRLQLSAAQLYFISQDTLSSGDTVALVRVDAGHYLVLGRVVSGESLTADT